MNRQIEFTLTQYQLEILCNHFGVNPEEQEDFELCELLDKAIDNLVEQSSSEAITLATPIKKGVNKMNLINTLESLSEKDAERIDIFTKEYDLLLKGSRENLLKVLCFNLELCDVIEVRDNEMGKVIVLDMEMKRSE